MQKEIFEQPIVVAQSLLELCPAVRGRGGAPDGRSRSCQRQSRHDRCLRDVRTTPDMVAKYWFEQFARVPVDIDFASEFRYREPVLEPGGLALVHLPVRRNRRHPRGAAPCARRTSNPSRSSSTCPPARWRARRTCFCRRTPGPEIGVATTKAFTCQLAVLAALAANFARAKGRLCRGRRAADRRALPRSPGGAQRRARP